MPSGRGISFPPGSKLQELHIAGTGCDVIDLAGCASLDVMHTGHVCPNLVLPTSVESLCLHNALPAYADFHFGMLDNLTFFKVGVRAEHKGVLKCLPELPPSMLKLDLWDSAVTNLDQLTSLTRLQALRMPLPPTPQQLSSIKCLCQLRHIEVTANAGKGPLAAAIVVIACLSMHAQPYDASLVLETSRGFWALLSKCCD